MRAMFAYQKNCRYFAQVPGAVETPAQKELKALGALDIVEGFRGYYFTADDAALYRINYQARLITRILAPLVSFECRNRNDLYRAGSGIDWLKIFSPKETFSVVANVADNFNIKNSHFAALCLKDAIADYFTQKAGKRPFVEKQTPSLWINLHIAKTRATISLDVSGGSMHRRGYRKETIEAPMQEILAASVIALTQWNGKTPLYDPMCGSGTLLCEALMSYCRIPSGYLRSRFGLFFLPEFDRQLWKTIKAEARKQMRELPDGMICGSDKDKAAIAAVYANAPLLPGGDAIRISKKDFNAIAGLENRTIVCNPPYGIRMQPNADLHGFYKGFGDFLKQRCKGSAAFIYFGNRELIKSVGLKPAWKIPISNAGLDGRLVKYELY